MGELPVDETRKALAALLARTRRMGGGAFIEALEAARVLAQPSGSLRRVRHRKRGSTYEVLGQAEAQVSTGTYRVWPERSSRHGDGLPARLVRDGLTLTVYRCEQTGKLCCRFPDEFEDGRFEDLPALAPTCNDALQVGSCPSLASDASPRGEAIERERLKSKCEEFAAWFDERGMHGSADNARLIARALYAHPAPAPAFRRVRHAKRGSTYEVLGEAKAQVSVGVVQNRVGPTFGKKARQLVEGDNLTVYRAADGSLWCRFPDEFEDGRFEDIEPAIVTRAEVGHGA